MPNTERSSEWRSTRSPAPGVVPTWSSGLIGSLLHLAVQDIVRKPGGRDRVASVAAGLTPVRLAPTHALMVRQRLAQGVELWLDLFDPRPTWRLVAVERQLDDVRPDIMWLDEHGRLIVEELKTGGLTPEARRQADNQNAVGSALHGPAWGGVRMVSLLPQTPQVVLVPASAGGAA